MSNNQIIDGILITIFGDMGPNPIVNTSSLNEEISMKLAIAGMTILSMGYGGDGIFEKRHFRLHGPIPVPDSGDSEALAISFKVKATSSQDERVLEYGRESTLWIVFPSKHRTAIYAYHSQFETQLNEVLTTIKEEHELSNSELISEISDRLRRILAVESTHEKDNVIGKEDEIDIQQPFKFLTVDNDGELTPITNYNEIYSVSILIFVNTITKSIFNIRIKESIPQRRLFLAARAASNLNSDEYKSEFSIRDVSDEMEREFLMEKIDVIIQQLG